MNQIFEDQVSIGLSLTRMSLDSTCSGVMRILVLTTWLKVRVTPQMFTGNQTRIA